VDGYGKKRRYVLGYDDHGIAELILGTFDQLMDRPVGDRGKSSGRLIEEYDFGLHDECSRQSYPFFYHSGQLVGIFIVNSG